VGKDVVVDDSWNKVKPSKRGRSSWKRSRDRIKGQPLREEVGVVVGGVGVEGTIDLVLGTDTREDT
jgi:hypothetical protein